MAKKSSKANKGKAVASKAAGTSRGNSSSSQSSASSPPLHGAKTSSASTSLSPLPAATASPASVLPNASVGASNSRPARAPPPPPPPQRPPPPPSPAAQVPPAGFRAAAGDGRMSSVERYILDLLDCDRRENALAELSMKRVAFQGLAPLLWFSFGTVAILLQEVLSVYPLLSPPSLTPEQSNRVCNALALLQVPDTRVIIFLLSSEIMPLCLRAMETGSALSRAVECLKQLNPESCVFFPGCAFPL
ncbi:UNVERIFIED_CONTAM: CCR4-NOT transcription complex subunit [Sesamum radiatum]|uniref:CCR4-NOT transcription complex subunit n=1 Tax=Sesamum radiatum TaxID=300843 RepID=A0AAW2T324_SESRA